MDEEASGGTSGKKVQFKMLNLHQMVRKFKTFSVLKILREIIFVKNGKFSERVQLTENLLEITSAELTVWKNGKFTITQIFRQINLQ